MVPPRKKKSSGVSGTLSDHNALTIAETKILESAMHFLKKGAPHDIRQAGILNLGFKAVAFRAHQALPVWDAHNSATLGSNQNN